jgi:hypothetical protein
MEINIVFAVPYKIKYLSVLISLYCVFTNDKSDIIILHVSYAREKQTRRRETREVKYFPLKLW